CRERTRARPLSTCPRSWSYQWLPLSLLCGLSPPGARSIAPLATVRLDAGGDLAGLVGLKHLLARFARPDPDRVLDGEDEDLPVSDLTRPGVLENRVRHDADVLVVDHDLELHLRPQVDGQLRASVVLG